MTKICWYFIEVKCPVCLVQEPELRQHQSSYAMVKGHFVLHISSWEEIINITVQPAHYLVYFHSDHTFETIYIFQLKEETRADIQSSLLHLTILPEGALLEVLAGGGTQGSCSGFKWFCPSQPAGSLVLGIWVAGYYWWGAALPPEYLWKTHNHQYKHGWGEPCNEVADAYLVKTALTLNIVRNSNIVWDSFN